MYGQEYASPLSSLRPCWTNLLSILRGPSPHQSCPPLQQSAMPDSSETGETGGKSETRSSDYFSFQFSDRLTCPAFLACLAV
jgi:hypothetical protein